MQKPKMEGLKLSALVLEWKKDPLASLQALSQSSVMGIVLAGIFGFLFGRAAIFGTLAPFGLSYVGAVRRKSAMVAATVGAVFASITLKNADSLRYIAALCILLGGKILFSSLKLDKRLKYSSLLLVLSVCLFTGLGSLLHTTSSAALLLLLVETTLCVSYTYFMQIAGVDITADCPASRKKVALFLSGSLMLLSLSSLYVSFFSIGRIIAVFCILLACWKYGIKGGAIAGIACGVAASLSNRDLSYLAASFGLGGLASGLLSAHPLTSSCAFLLIFWLTGSYFSDISVLFILAESAVGAALFFVYTMAFSKNSIGAHPKEAEGQASPEDCGQMRIQEVSKGIGDFASLLTRQLEKGCDGDMGELFQETAQQVCSRCGLNIYCWGKEYQKTMDSLNQAAVSLCKNGELASEDLNETALEKCVRGDEFRAALNQSYKRLQSGLRESEMRELQASIAQYSAFSALMNELSIPVAEKHYDSVGSDRLLHELRKESLVPLSCALYESSHRLEAVITFPSLADIPACAKTVIACASKAAGRQFASPEASVSGDHVRLLLRERSPFYLEESHRCRPQAGQRQCGDSFRLFPSRNGDTVALLCDGMGSGRTAQSDSLFAVRAMESLVKNGVSPECALQFIGANLNYSGKESFTTVDLLQISPYTGEAVFVKSGAAPSFLLSGNSITPIPCESLPIGILPGANPAVFKTVLHPGDAIVMISDGAMGDSGDTDPLRALLLTAYLGRTDSPASMVEKIFGLCEDRRDDVSAAVLFFKELPSL